MLAICLDLGWTAATYFLGGIYLMKIQAMNQAMKLGRALVSLAIVAASASTPSNAEGPNDFLVRLKTPNKISVNSAFSRFQKNLNHFNPDFEIINSEEGLFRLKFENEKDALRAQDILKQSESISHIAPNLTYYPAIHYQFRERESTQHFSPLSFLSEIIFPNASTIPPIPFPIPFQKPGADPLVANDWALSAIRMDQVQDLGQGRPSILTAVIDTGIDYTHEDLVAALWRKSGDPQEVGFDFAHNHSKPYDVVKFDLEGCLKDSRCRLGIETKDFLVNPGHGTHCAGHVASVYNNSLGIHGIGSQAKVMGLKFFYDAGEERAGGGDDAAAIRAIDYAISHGVKVINASWGSRHLRDEGEKSELKQAFIRARTAGILIVVAAGNSGIDQDSVADPVYPAYFNLDNLIVVAATDPQDALADFSNYGAKSVHIAAPGVKIFSTIVGNQYSDLTASVSLANGKKLELSWDGTSMAAPIVAGAAALVWSKYPHEGYGEIRKRILNSARKVSLLEGKIATGGILDVAVLMQ